MRLLKDNKQEKLITLFLSTVLFLLLPFVYSTYLYDPESAPRFGLFSIALAIVFAFFFYTGYRFSLKNFVANKTALLFLLLLIVYILNTSRSYDTGEAIYTCCRHGIMFFFFLVAVQLFNKDKNLLLWFITGIAIAVIIFCIIAGFQVMGNYAKTKDGFKLFQLHFYISSFLSNKNFFSETLVLSVPFLIIGIRQQAAWLKLVSIFSLLLCLCFIIMLQGASSWVALGAGMAVYLFINYLTANRKARKYYIATAVVSLVFLISGITIFVKSKNAGEFTYKLNSAFNYFTGNKAGIKNSYQYSSTTERLLTWKHTVKIIKTNPVTGVGTANWKIVYPSYGPFGIPFMDSGNLRLEHPHNDFLLIGAEQGFTGMLIYILIFFLAIRTAWIQVKNSDNFLHRENLKLLLCTLVIFFILSFFEFPFERFYSLILFTITFSYLLSETSFIIQEQKNMGRRDILLAVIIIICGFAAVVNYYRYSGERHYARMVQFQRRHSWDNMLYEANHARNTFFINDPLGIPLNWHKGFALFHSGDMYSAKDNFIKAVKENPFYAQGWNDLGTCYEQESDYTTAIKCYRQSMKTNSGISLLNLSAAYYNSGYTDSAYHTISLYPRNYGHKTYLSFLLAILRKKINESALSRNESVKKKVQEELKNERLLLRCYETATLYRKDFETVYIDSVMAGK